MTYNAENLRPHTSEEQATLFETPRFSGALLHDMRGASRSIRIQMMAVGHTHASQLYERELKAAKASGKISSLIVDGYSQMHNGSQFNLLTLPGNAYAKFLGKQKDEMFDRLTRDGILTITNRPNPLTALLPTCFRDHKKYVVIDGEIPERAIVYMGGINEFPDNTRKNDFMIRRQNPQLARELVRIHENTKHRIQNKRDYRIQCGPEDTLFIDAGVGTSITVDDLCMELARGGNTKFVSQMPPDGKVLQRLIEKADRGDHVQVILDSMNWTSDLLKKSYQIQVYKTLRSLSKHGITCFISDQPVHAKGVYIQSQKNNDGNNALYFGSHNFTEVSVKIHTEECTVKTTNHDIHTSFNEYFDTLAASSDRYSRKNGGNQRKE